MAIKLAAGGLAIVILAIMLQGCLFGGDNEPTTPLTRPNSIPTATMPPSLPEPILVGEAQSTSGGTSPNTTSAAGSTYVVASGDTLGAIASSQSIAADQQAAWIQEVLRLNGIDDPRQLAVGQELQLPRVPTQVATRAATTGTPQAGVTGTPARTTTPASGGAGTPTPTTPAGGGAGTYTVVSGDFPVAIAAKLGIPEAQQLEWANQLLSLNNITATGLNVGQVLRLPPTPATSGSTPAAATSTPTR